MIIYDAAYEAYIVEENIPHTIYECEGAKTFAIEIRSYSKKAGFTGTRLGYTIVPKELRCGEVSLNSLWARRHGTKFNGAPYMIQAAAAAVYTSEGQQQTREQIAYYMSSWDFFDFLLEKANVVGTPGSGFGPSGEGYFRLTAFGSYESTIEAIERIKKL